jgi:sodium-type flagellar protein MotY
MIRRLLFTRGLDRRMRFIKTILRSMLMTLLSVCVAGFALNAAASYRHYESELTDSKWQFEGNILKCSLTHEISGYGVATFTSEAHFDKSIKFTLIPKRVTPFNEGFVTIKSIAPEWQTGALPTVLGKAPVARGATPIYLNNRMAWQLLLELERGMTPTLYYDGWVNPRDWISVGLSGVNFKSNYESFNQCISNLLPYSFEDVKNTVIFFPYEKYYVTTEAKMALDKVIKYVKVSDNIDKVIITGHTDSVGEKRFNKWMAEQRAVSVKNYLKEKGINPRRFVIRTLGENLPVARNTTVDGRANNRRAVVQLVPKIYDEAQSP